MRRFRLPRRRQPHASQDVVQWQSPADALVSWNGS
jgi:hypothetical protein